MAVLSLYLIFPALYRQMTYSNKDSIKKALPPQDFFNGAEGNRTPVRKPVH